MCVCVLGIGREQEREGEEEMACMEVWECMDVWVLLHGNPLNNCEVAHTKSTLPSFGLGPRMERERGDFWAFCP